MANETDKGLISKINKQLIRVNTKKKKTIKKWEKGLNRHLSKDDVQIANIHEKMLNIARYSVQFSRSVMSDSATP